MSSIAVGTFRDTVLEILGEYEYPLTVRDIRHILVESKRERGTLTQQAIYSACLFLLSSNQVVRSQIKILHNFNPNGRAAYGYSLYKEDVPDTRKVLWLISNLEFNTTNVPKPDYILYDEAKPIIQHDLVGRYRGVTRTPAKLKDSAYYADKGWRVVEL